MTLLYRTIKTVNSTKTCGPQQKRNEGGNLAIPFAEKKSPKK
jgi:hypothetical protein